MKRKVVMMDVDGVLADFIWGWRTMAREYMRGATKYHRKLLDVYSQLAQPSWNYDPGLTKAVSGALWENIKESATFWSTLTPLIKPSEAWALKGLAKYHDLYFATARLGHLAKRQTEQWLREHLDLEPTVILTKRKGNFCYAVKADYALEDKADNACAIAWISEGTTPYLVDRPYNRFDPDYFGSHRVRRVSTVLDFCNAVMEGK